MAPISYQKTREDMCKVAHYMWDRKLTNAAGGNFAVKVDEDRILISPSLMSERHFCELEPEDFLLINTNMEIPAYHRHDPCSSSILHGIRSSE